MVNHHKPKTASSLLLVLVLALAVCTWSAPAHAVDFIQSYTRGKLLFKQRLFKDAVVELNKAITQTARGRTHFGAHYYLARALFWQPDIARAMGTLNKAKAFIKNKLQRRAYRKAVQQIRTLYAKVTFVPQVDPDEVGRLNLKLRPKATFSHKHKRRYFRIVMKQIAKKGGVSPSGSLYLPKGEYEVGLKRNQCLQYGLVSGGKIARDLEVGNSDVSLNVAKQRSCKCLGNQVIVKNPKRPKELICSCPAGTILGSDKINCKKAKPPVVWPWITLGVIGGLGLVAGAVAIPLSIEAQRKSDKVIMDPASGLW